MAAWYRTGGPRSWCSRLLDTLWAGGEVTRLGKGRVIASSDVDASLTRIGVGADFQFSGASEGAEIPFLHRKLWDGDSYFLVNRSNQPERITARFRVSGKVPELWHAETGTTEPVSYTIEQGETVVPLDLGIDDAVHVVFRKPATAATLSVIKPQQRVLSTLAGPWDVSFQADRGAPPRATFASLAPLDSNANPAIKYFSGEATYEKDFVAPKGWKPGQPLWLDLGEVREVAAVTINGKLAGYSWHAPYRLEISPMVARGKNHITIKVANLWVNRLIGDQQPGAQKVTWTAMPTYRADAPLRKSGLIGPVTLSGALQGN